MIAACPKCGARYRIDDGRLPPQGARLRCARCEAVFKVRGAGQPRAQAAATPAPRTTAQQPAPQPSASGGSRQRELVLIADAEVESGRATASALSAWGLRTILVHDGVEAILSIQRALPRAVVIDAALPKMFGFQICELMKRNESLREIHVVLVGAIHDHERYRRPPSELYGADAYLERPQLPDGLGPILGGFGLALVGSNPPPAAAPLEPRPPQPDRRAERPADSGGVRSEPRAALPRRDPLRIEELPPPPAPSGPTPPRSSTPHAPSRSAAPHAPSRSAAPHAPSRSAAPHAPSRSAAPHAPSRSAAPHAPSESAAPQAPGLDPSDIEKAERLARIVVSDIVLYNAQKFDAAVASGNVLDAMQGELEEGRSLFRQRVDSSVRASRDFLAQELLRVARQRGGG